MAGTNMNEASSRSHAIFTIVATKTDYDKETGAEGLTVSKVCPAPTVVTRSMGSP